MRVGIDFEEGYRTKGWSFQGRSTSLPGKTSGIPNILSPDRPTQFPQLESPLLIWRHLVCLWHTQCPVKSDGTGSDCGAWFETRFSCTHLGRSLSSIRLIESLHRLDPRHVAASDTQSGHKSIHWTTFWNQWSWFTFFMFQLYIYKLSSSNRSCMEALRVY